MSERTLSLTVERTVPGLYTGYYRTINNVHILGCDSAGDSNYGPYDVFCLQTRLQPLVYRLLNRDTQILFLTSEENKKMELKIQILSSDGDVISLSEHVKSELQTKVDEIISKNMGYCLINGYELYLSCGYRYPLSWFYSVLPYTGIGSEYNPFITQTRYGPEIYLVFNRDSDYNRAYINLSRDILNAINNMYQQGSLYGAENIAEAWNLELLNDDFAKKLYQATWQDKRFAPIITDFLIQKMEGDEYIYIKIPDNLVKRHYIAAALNNEGIVMCYSGDKIRVVVKSLDEAQYVASLIETVVSGTTEKEREKVFIYEVSHLSDIHRYLHVSQRILGPEQINRCTSYETTDNMKKYVFSCLVGVDTPMAVSEEIYNRVNE